MATHPPLPPDLLEPAAMRMSPPEPALAAPTVKVMLPDMPTAAAPVDKVMEPEDPVLPELLVVMLMAPLLPKVEPPLAMET